MLQHLEINALSHFIANASREIIGCDRVSVLIRRGSKYRVTSVSGLDTVDQRSTVIRAMQQVAAQVAEDGQPLWIDRQSANPPAIEAVEFYWKQSNADFLSVIPLGTAKTDPNGARSDDYSGVLVVECFTSSADLSNLKQRAKHVADQASPVVNHVSRLRNWPLPNYQKFGKSRQRTWLSQLSKPFIGLAVAVILITALCLLPADFNVTARGELQPVEREDIYAPYDGVVVDLPALRDNLLDNQGHETLTRDGQYVEKGEVVVGLHNANLDYELATLFGEKASTVRQLDTVAITLEQLSREASPTNQAHSMN